jgi:hypothetical protein
LTYIARTTDRIVKQTVNKQTHWSSGYILYVSLSVNPSSYFNLATFKLPRI